MVPRFLRHLTLPIALAASAAPPWADAAAAFTPAEARTPMTVTLVRSDAAACGADCPEWLALTGAITPATPALLESALARMGRKRLPVLVDSPGGAVVPAIAMGRMIRARGLDVAVGGTALTDCAAGDRTCAARRRDGLRPGFVAGGVSVCASACALLLAAGARRVVGENSYVGVHQMSAKQTFARFRTLFRVLWRREGGRRDVVSRTPIGREMVSSRTVQVRAPEAFYSEVERYLRGMGIGEALMPLMRSAPPSGIHWMTAAELASTRLANDTTEARTLVAQVSRPAATAGPGTSAMALASATLGPAPRAGGIVDWRVDQGPGGPALTGTVDIPERHLHGSVTVRRATDPAATDAYAVTVDLGPATAIEPGHVWTVQAPRLCDRTTCDRPIRAVAARDDGQGRRDFGVAPAWGSSFLSALRDRDWMGVGLTEAGGTQGTLWLSLAQGGRAVVAEWEHLCCGLADPAAESDPEQPVTSSVTARVALREAAGVSDLDTAAPLSWTAPRPLDRPSLPGTVALAGRLAIPKEDFGLSLALAPTGAPDLVAVTIEETPRSSRFGPARQITVPPVWSADHQVAVLTESGGPTAGGQGFRVVLSIGAEIPVGATLSIEMEDRSRRRLSLAIPTDGALRALFHTVGQGSDRASR